MSHTPEEQKRKLGVVDWSAVPVGFSLTPIQLLGFILKVALQDRITDDEISQICSTYYDTVKKWWWSESDPEAETNLQ